MAGTRFIVAGRFIDGSGADVQKNIFLAVKDTFITAIGSAADLPDDAITAIDDFSHCTIVPPLVDCSVFLSQSSSIDRQTQLSIEKADLAKKVAMLAQHIRYHHAHGVLGVANGEAITYLIEQYQKESAQGNTIDIRSAGNSEVGNFLKINYSANIEDEETPNPCLNYEELSRILQGRGDKKAVVIANGRRQVKEALEAGCDAIEQGYDMGETNLKTMANNNVLWIPSVLRAKNGLDGASSGGNVCCRFSLRYVAPGKPNPDGEAFWKRMLAEQLRQLAMARKLGVRTAVGTGAGNVGILHGESVVEEMKLFIKAGYSLEETIRCASENGARFFDMDKLGKLTVGRKATFLITRGSVKQLPRKLAYLEGIYVDGSPCTIYSKNPVRAA